MEMKNAAAARFHSAAPERLQAQTRRPPLQSPAMELFCATLTVTTCSGGGGGGWKWLN